MHGRHGRFGQPRGHFGQQFHTISGAIVEIISAFRPIAGHKDDASFLVLVGVYHADLLRWEVLFESLAVIACAVVEIVAHGLAVSGTKRSEQSATLARIGERIHVVPVVFEQHFALFGGGRIHEHQGGFVSAAIAHAPHHFVVGSEERVAYRFTEIGGEHRAECFAFVVAVENLGVHAVDDGIDHTQTTVVVGGPSLIVAGIFGQERKFARVEIESVGIEGFGVAAIHFNEDLPGHFGEVIDDVDAHSREIGVGAFVTSVAANAEKVVVLVAAIVFGINQAVVVGP